MGGGVHARGLPEPPLTLALDIHGYRVRVHGSDAAAIENVRRDFAYFVRPGSPADGAVLSVELRRAAPPGPPPGAVARLRSPECVAYDAGPLRYADYGGRGGVTWHTAAETVSIVSPDPHLLHEASYMVILTRAGEAFDRRGIHRLHGLAVARDGRATLCLLPSGGGKTTLAMALLRAGNGLLLSDEQAAIDGRLRVLPFPLRLGLAPGAAALDGIGAAQLRTLVRAARGPKVLVDVAWCAHALARAPAPLGAVLFGRRAGAAAPALVPLGAAAAARLLLVELVRARELPQTKIYFFRRDARALARLGRILAARARRALHLARAVPSFHFALGEDPAANAAALGAALARDVRDRRP